MRVAVEYRLSRPLSDVTVAVQGLGRVGYELCKLLHSEGAKLIVAEPRSELAARAVVEFGAELRIGNAIVQTNADVFAPCALGGALTKEVAAGLSARIVCGGANNQLATSDVAALLNQKGVLYAPDYLVNAGGIINVAAEYFGWDQTEVDTRIAAIGPRLLEVFQYAAERGMTTADAANERAKAVICAGPREIEVCSATAL